MEKTSFTKTVLFFILTTSTLLAGEINGIITDAKTGQPLPGATIMISGTKSGSSSNIDGKYAVDNLPDGDITVIIRLISYEKTTRKIHVGLADIIKLDVAMAEMPWELDAVVVTATRRKQILKDVPVTTEIITKEEMAQTGATTVAQALDSNIGVTINDDVSGKAVMMRGVDPSRVLILVDGQKMVGRVKGSIDLGQISLSNVDHIEIVKGSGSTLYGSDALGGVINIITQKPSDNGHLGANIEYGSFAAFDPEFQVEAKRNKFGLLINGKYAKTDGFDLDKSTPHTNGQEAIKRYNLDTKLAFTPKESFQNTLTLGYMHERKQWIESEYFAPLQTTFIYDDYEWNDRYDAGLSSKIILSPKTDIEAMAHGSYYNHDWSKYARSGTLNDTSLTKDDIIEGSLLLNHSFRKNLIMTTGADVSQAGLKSSQISSGQKSVLFGDAYMQMEWTLLKNIDLLPGLRWEQHSAYGSHLNPSMNAKWSLSDRFSLRGSASRGFRAPSIKELYFIFDHSAAGYIVYGGGNQLNPETSNNYSLTAEFNYDRRGLHRLTYFHNDLNNLIDFGLEGFSSTYWRGIYTYQNIFKARTEGLEWESKVKICSGWDLSFSYTYLRARDLSTKTDLVNRPRNTLKFRSFFYVPKWETSLTLWGTFHDRKLWTSEGDTPDRTSDIYAPPLTTINLNFNKQIFKFLDAYFRIENITNSINVTYGYWPPRSYIVGIKLNFTNGADASKE